MQSVFSGVVECLVDGPRESDGARVAGFMFPESFAGFDGHFPGNPVVPGIVQIYAAMITAGRENALGEVKRCKFMRPVLPGERVVVTLVTESIEGALRCKADITAAGDACASMTLILVPDA